MSRNGLLTAKDPARVQTWYVNLRRGGPVHQAVRESVGFMLKCGPVITRWNLAADGDNGQAKPRASQRCRRCFG